MKYAFNTWAYSSFPAWLPCYPLDEAIRRIAAIGYDGVEIRCATPHEWPAYLNRERRAETKTNLSGKERVAVALCLLENAECDRGLVDLALEAGFCDQAHFCREIKTFTGRTPSEIRQYV